MPISQSSCSGQPWHGIEEVGRERRRRDQMLGSHERNYPSVRWRRDYYPLVAFVAACLSSLSMS
jgi:hypothetical protein